MKKRAPLLDELLIWLRGRFSLTGEEIFWLLLVLIIVWTGLIGRYVYLHSRSTDPLPPDQAEQQSLNTPAK